MNSNITDIIFDFVGHISKVFKIIPNKYYNENKATILNINKYIINNNQNIITPTIKDSDGDIINIELSNCSAYKCKEQRPNNLFIKYRFRISPDLTNTDILNHLMEIEPGEEHNTCITFRYLNKRVIGSILNYDIKKTYNNA